MKNTYIVELMQSIRKHIHLAVIYAEDGAFATCAKMLHEAADMCMAEHDRRQRILNQTKK